MVEYDLAYDRARGTYLILSRETGREAIPWAVEASGLTIGIATAALKGLRGE